MKLQIIQTSDGSQTLQLPEINETYHSIHGAITESNHVYIERGYLFQSVKNPTVFEVGFGTGLNALLTAISAEQTKRKTHYISIEKFPLEKKITDQLNYGFSISKEAQQLFNKIHACNWGEIIQISEFFSLLKLEADLIEEHLINIPNSDVIYFDAFGPDKQPEMWTPEIFLKIFNITSPDGVFVTYSAKGEVRRQLARCGFSMERLPGPPGKFQMLRGIKKKANI